MRASRYLEDVETLPRAELLRLQEQRLLESIPFLYEHSPVTREAWDQAGVKPSDVRTLADFKRKVPFLTKDGLRDFRSRHGDPFCGQLSHPLHELNFIGSSSGTTGDPTLFATAGHPSERGPFDPGDFSTDFWNSCLREVWEWGLRPGDTMAWLAPTMRGPSYFSTERMGATSVFFDHYPGEMGRFAELSRQLRPKVAWMMSTPLLLALEQLERDTGLDMRDVFSSYEAVIFGGEPLSTRLSGVLARWGVSPLQIGSVADALVGYECRERDGLHVWEDQVVAECLDPETGVEVPDGARGELVITSIADRSDPLVRFRGGDLVEFTREKCRCGRTHARFRILGRLGDEVVVGGRVLLPRDIWDAIENVPETMAGLFQVIRPTRELSTLSLRVGYAGQPDLVALRRKVEDSVESRTGVRPVVELVPNDELLKLGPPHKIPRTAKA